MNTYKRGIGWAKSLETPTLRHIELKNPAPTAREALDALLLSGEPTLPTNAQLIGVGAERAHSNSNL